MAMGMDILTSGSDSLHDRRKAVLLSAKILSGIGIAFFPLDLRLLLHAFRRQVRIIPYSVLSEAVGQNAEAQGITPQMLSEDGFSIRMRDVLFDLPSGPMTSCLWRIYYNESLLQTRVRFTLVHELGHVVLNHHQILDADTFDGLHGDPMYKAADDQADQFSINLLAPAPAVWRLLREHGFSCPSRNNMSWQITDRGAPALKHLGVEPDPVQLLITAFGISRTAAERRLNELPGELRLWRDLDPELYQTIEELPRRSGWFCWVCGTQRRSSSPYCAGCGKPGSYQYKDYGRFARPVIPLRENGQFAFCSVCGNTEYDEGTLFCPVCGSPVVNECENRFYSDGDFIRSGMNVIRGTHRCHPTDIYCCECGVTTRFGSQHGPRPNLWLPGQPQSRCRIMSTAYPPVFNASDSSLHKCPSCGSTETIREGRYCAKCKQPLTNLCMPEAGPHHAAWLNDRYCRQCGSPTLFFQSGLLPDYAATKTYQELITAERNSTNSTVSELLINSEGTLSKLREVP